MSWNSVRGCGARLDQPGSFRHGYVIRKKVARWRKRAARWDCDCLYDTFDRYSWSFSCKSLGIKGETFEDSCQVLDQLQAKLRRAVRAQDNDAAAAACLAVLEWGGVQARNGQWIEKNRERLIHILEHDRCLLCMSSPTTESLGRLHRFNAGMVKLYSLLLDDFIIYDGRVGAALGLLTREWCLSTGRACVPDLLRFPWGKPKEEKDADQPKNRNPSTDGLRFPALRPQPKGAAFHALWTIRASWLLQATLTENDSRFREAACPLRAFEAALFMIGYDLGGGKGANDRSGNPQREERSEGTRHAREASKSMVQTHLKFAHRPSTTPRK